MTTSNAREAIFNPVKSSFWGQEQMQWSVVSLGFGLAKKLLDKNENFTPAKISSLQVKYQRISQDRVSVGNNRQIKGQRK